MSGIARSEFSVVGSFERYMEHVAAGFALTRGASHEVIYANAAFRALFTLDGTMTLGGPVSALFSDADARALGPILDRAYRTGVVSRNRSLQPVDECAHPLRCTVWPDVSVSGETNHLLLEVRTATPGEVNVALQRQVAERLLMSALREHDAAALAHLSWKEAAFLATESRRLSSSLDEDVTVSAMKRMSIPHLGAWCFIDMLDNNDEIQRLTVIHPDHDKQEILDGLRSVWIPTSGDSYSLAAVLRSGASSVVVEGREVARVSDQPAVVEALRRLEVTSLLTVPLRIEDEVRGAITFVGDLHGSHVTPENIELAKDLANQSALALERARLHGEALALQKRAEAANEAKNAFLGMMSHELRTPLSAIAGYVDLILLELRGPVTDDQRRDLGRIRSNQRYLMGLIDELLGFAAAGSQRISCRTDNLGVEEILSASCSLLEPLLQEKSLTCDDISCSPTLMLLADRAKVMQIMVNILSNSIKFTQPGGRIWLAADSTKDSVMLHVSDSGIGIAPDKLESIFDPFVQLSSGPARTGAGVGLGLSISRELARAMRGNLTVESEEGVGSKFTLTLPRAGIASSEPTHGALDGMLTDVPLSAPVHREP